MVSQTRSIVAPSSVVLHLPYPIVDSAYSDRYKYLQVRVHDHNTPLCQRCQLATTTSYNVFNVNVNPYLLDRSPTPSEFFLRRQYQTGLQARMQGYYQQPQMQGGYGQMGGMGMDPRMMQQQQQQQMMGGGMMGPQGGGMMGMNPMMGGGNMAMGMGGMQGGQAWRQLVRSSLDLLHCNR